MLGLEKQRNYLMKKLQETKSSLETEKFSLLKGFEIEKLELLKKIEELLMLNDILIGQKKIYGNDSKKISTEEIMSILTPASLEGSVTIRDVVRNLQKKYLLTNEISIQTETSESKL